MQKILSSLFIITACLVMQTPLHAKHKLNLQPENLWMVYAPIQCFGNPWEKEWLKTTKKSETKFPRMHEPRLFWTYYQQQGLTLARMRTKLGRQACNTCDCERGDLYLVYLPFPQQQDATALGFRKATQMDISDSVAVPSYDLH